MSADRTRDYELGEPIEEGSRTVTYRARWRAGPSEADDAASSALGRAVLVKTLKSGVRLTPALEATFRREAERLLRLDHPLLPTVVDFVADEQQLALVFPDHGGVRLDAVLDRVDRLEPQCAVAVAMEVSRALAAIHRQGWAHGGLVASDVELGPAGTVRLFGLPSGAAAEQLDSEPEVDAPLRLPANMAPEQIVGEPADARTDVFLLGLLLYRMVTGEPAFQAAGEAGVAQRIRHARPPRLQRHAPDAPPALERIVLRCLSKRPRDRYRDMSSLTTALVRALRSATSLPTEHLVTRALARADLAQELTLPAEGALGRGGALTRSAFRRLLWPSVMVLAVGALLWVLVAAFHEPPPQSASGVRGIEQQPARLRVLARPWAEVHLNGELIDVTPIGQPIEVSPGRHRVRFKHPHAPDQVRTVEVIAGQTVWLDVTMAVEHPQPDAGKGDAGSADASP
jgi:serine/threonine-protein kinase